jgi:DNA-directed RNA polymerase subunit RPC12/RpoP
VSNDNHCPSCGDDLVSKPKGTSLRCPHCGWKLITRDEWRALPPFQQGWAIYMQGSWPTSELAEMKNPYADGTAAWTEFCHGERRAMLSAQDGEE